MMLKNLSICLTIAATLFASACDKKVDAPQAPKAKAAIESGATKASKAPATKTPLEQKLALVDEAAKEGSIAGVKKYRELFPGTLLAEGKFYIDLQKELRGEPSIEAVRKAVMNDNLEIARSEAKRYTRDEKKALKLVDDFVKQLLPVVEEHAKNIYKRDKSSGFSMGHKLYPNTPIPELKRKLE